MSIRTDKKPMLPELNQKLFDSYENKASYVTQFDLIVRILERLNADTNYGNIPYLSIYDIPAQRLIDCIQSIEDSGFQKNALYALVKLAEIEKCDNLTAHKDFLQLQNYVRARNDMARNMRRLADLEIISWDEVIKISNIYISSITKPYSLDSKLYMGLNKLILANMVINMPILRTEEYCNILLNKDNTKDCNYIQRDEDPNKWELVIDKQKSDILNRRLSLHRSVVDLLLQYDAKLRKRVIDPPLRKDSKTKERGENESYLYLFKSAKGKVPNDKTILEAVKELYGQELTVMKLRVLSATNFKNQTDVTVEMRAQLARDMGHLFSTHVRDYERL